MRKIVIAVVLFLCSSAANAEWKKVFAWSDSSSSYIEDSTISAQGQLRYAWTLINFGKKRDNGTISMRRGIQIDCNGRQARFLDISSYSGQWARGTLVSEMKVPTGWFPIISNSTDENDQFKFSTFKFLCG